MKRAGMGLVAAVIFTLLSGSLCLGIDEARVLLFSNEHLRLWGWRSTEGGMTWANTCAEPAGSAAIGNIVVRLEFVDFFGNTLPGSTNVTLQWVEAAKALCHWQGVPASAKDFFKIRARIIHYDHE